METVPTPIIMYPPELWRIILGNLKSNSGELLKLRLVSKTIKIIADELLKEHFSMWSPTFYESGLDLANSLTGTRLSTPEAIDIFLHAGVEDRVWNPFPNGTLIFIPNRTLDREKRKLFYSKFPNLIESFGEDILHLIYTFNEDAGEIEYFREFYNIFGLKNLKSLALSKLRWSSPKKIEIEGFPFPIQNKLEELQILGTDSWFPFFSINPNALKGLKSFSCGWLVPLTYNRIGNSLEDNLTGYNKMGEFQLRNLTRLKLVCPSRVAIDYFCKPKPGVGFAPKINQISLSFPNLCGSIHLNRPSEMLAVLDHQADNLETIHLNLDPKLLIDLENPPTDLSNVKFVKLKHLVVSFCVIISWGRLLSELNEKMCCLERVTFTLNHLEVRGKSARQFYDCVKDAWHLLPESVEIIQVPHFGWRLKRGDEINFDTL